MGPDRCLLMQWVAFQERNLEFRALESFILDSKRACHLLWRETLFLSSKAVCHTNHLENTFQSKRQFMSLLPRHEEIWNTWKIVSSSTKPTVTFIKSDEIGSQPSRNAVKEMN